MPKNTVSTESKPDVTDLTFYDLMTTFAGM